MNEIKFEKRYKKLDNNRFFTIRTEEKGNKNTAFKVIADGKEVAIAILTDIKSIHICDITTPFLKMDTNTDSREEALKSLKEHYPDLSENSVVFIHFFVWVKKNPWEFYDLR